MYKIVRTIQGKPRTVGILNKLYLEKGWEVVSAIPIQQNKHSLGYIEYVIKKEDCNGTKT